MSDTGTNVSKLCFVLSFSSLITAENALKLGREESAAKLKMSISLHTSCSLMFNVPCNWKTMLSLVVIWAPAWRIRARANGTSSLLQLETPSATTWTSYPNERRSRVD